MRRSTTALAVCALLARRCAAAPRPWANDTVLATIADRLAQQQVVPPPGLPDLDASVAAYLSLAVGPPWNRTFSDINYGFNDAAFWPSINHTVRTRAIATAWASPGSMYFNSSDAALEAWYLLDWWLVHTPNSVNWWYNQIGVGGYVGPTALLLWALLEPNQTAAVGGVLGRSSYAGETGANLVWQAGNVLVDGLLAGNRTKVAAAATVSFTEIAFAPGAAEGMKADGSFFQHGAQLYNGGYGQSFCYDIVNLLALCAGTPFAATPDQRDAFAGWLVAGTLRMIVYGPSGPMWDISVVGRDITRPYGSSLQFGFGQSGQQVSFVAAALAGIGGEYAAELAAFAAALNGTTLGPPVPALGHDHFYIGDYSVVTRPSWMASLRMQSSRTLRSECVNDEGILSLHLADGAAYVYLTGQEYFDIFPAWNWERIPGTLVHSGVVPPACSNAQGSSSNTFTGGASDGASGVAVQRFVAPLAQGVSADRLHAFFSASMPVRLSNITAAPVANASAHPVFLTLDSRRLNASEGAWVGSIAAPLSSARQLAVPGDYSFAADDATPVGWLWHGGIGYVVAPPPPGASTGTLRVSLSLAATGSWGSIGQEASYGNVSVPLVTAWMALTAPSALDIGYVVVPAVTLNEFTSALAADPHAWGATSGEQGLWSAAVPGSWKQQQQQLALGVYAAGPLASVPASAAFPAVTARCSGAGAALLLSMNATAVAVTGSSPAQVAWSVVVELAGIALQVFQGPGIACMANGTIAISAPPANGSSATFSCLREE